MLQIFADALLIATGMQPPHRPDSHRRRPTEQDETRSRRSWLSLSGLRR